MMNEYNNKKLTDINDVVRFLKQSPQNPYYDFDTDYTTNSPNYYDYLAKLKPLIQILAERIYDYDRELAKRFEEWDKNLEELPDDLKRMFLEWVDDGTLARILAQLLLDDYATKEEVNDLLNALENDLNEDLSNVKNDLENKINLVKNDLDNKIDNHINIYNKKNDHFIINVDEFTGTDHFIIQSALNKARDNGGGTVYVPSRLYELDNELIIYSNTTLFSELGTKYLRTEKGYMLINGDRDKNYSKYNGNGNIHIINGEFDGNGHDLDVKTGSNIVIAHADNVIIENVIVSNANSHHIEINSSKNVTVKNSKFLGIRDNLLYVEAIQLDLSTEGGFNAFGEHDNTPCENIYIYDNYFGKSNETNAIQRAIGTHATRIGAFMKNVYIENNVIDGSRDFAIQLLSYDTCHIKNNVFKDCAGGIIMYPVDPSNTKHMIDIYGNPTTQVQNTKNVLIENNTFNDIHTKQVVYSYGRKEINNELIIVKGNKVINSTNNKGMFLFNYTKDLELANNDFNNTNNTNMSLNEVKRFSIINNRIFKSDSYAGIRLQDNTTEGVIKGNILEECGGHGIEINNKCHNNIIDSNIIRSCNGNNSTDYSYNGIYVHSDCVYLIFSNNIFRTFNNFVYKNAIYITATNDLCIVSNNVSQKGTGDKYVLPSTAAEMNNI